MANQQITLTGRSGLSYSFTLFQWGQSFKALGGIYVAMTEANGRLQIQYIGQTGDLSQRPEHHHREQAFARSGVSKVAVTLVPTEAMRRSMEADLVSYYRPALNGTAHG